LLRPECIPVFQELREASSQLCCGLTQLVLLYENKTQFDFGSLVSLSIMTFKLLEFLSSFSVSFIGIYQLIGFETIEKVVEIVEEKGEGTVHT